MTELGDGAYRYEELPEWEQLPEGWDFHEVVDVAVDSADRVYVFSRSEHPVTVFSRDGSFLRAWGESVFQRPHGITIGPDGSLYCVDDVGHCVRRYTPEGQLLSTVGVPGSPAPLHSGEPFCQPTKVALAPDTGELYISDGYGNARVHVYTPDGERLRSWGEFGTDPGQFNLAHSVCTDGDGRVYVADRENHGIQIFSPDGEYLDQWNNMHRPCGLHILGDRVYIGQLPSHLPVNAEYPNIGACVSIHDLSGSRVASLGGTHAGEGPGQFTAPHGVAVDSRGDIYIAEVSWSAYGSKLDPPRAARSFRKLVKLA